MVLVALSWFATKSRFIYWVGVVVSALCMVALFSKPGRLVSRDGIFDQIALIGLFATLGLGCILFVLHPILSGRWAEK